METQFIEDSLLSLVVLTVNGLWNNQKVNSFQDVEILCHSNKARTFVVRNGSSNYFTIT